MSRDARAARGRILQFLVLAALLVQVASAGEIPQSLRDIVLGAGHRPIVEITLDGRTFHGLAPFSDVPYVLWPAEEADIIYDRYKAAEWIRRSAATLGHRDFEPRYIETTSWRGNEVWNYELVRQGISLHDARVSLHWREGRFIGLVNHVPLPIQSIENPIPSAMETGEYAYTPRRGEGGYTLRIARVLRETAADRVNTSLVVGGETVERIVMPLQTSASPSATFEEWSVPEGRFPDQIDIDSSGVVWFSQPLDNWVTSFDPATEVFTHYDTTGGVGPDGLMVDANDVLWTGLYTSGGLGRFDVATSDFTAFDAHYTPAASAIPNETTGGTVWVTDHANNKISEFDPGSLTWLQSLDMPTPACWVVGGTEDTVSLDVYFTEFGADRLGRKIFDGPIVDIDAPPGSGPAFAVYSDGFIYFSEWNDDRLGAYEISSGIITEYAYPVADETGGPIDATASGLIAVGTRNEGYIMVFDPATTSFDAYPIPTTFSGLKDGLRSDSNGSIWFTESGANKIAVLHLGSPAPSAEFSGNPVAGAAPLTVDFTDLSTNSPMTWSWSFGDNGTSSLQNPTHEYTDPGVYTVSLTAGNELGSSTETKIDYINVITPCPLSPAAVVILGQLSAQSVAFSWEANTDCQWAVHRASDPQDVLATPPVATVPFPYYREDVPSEPLVFYNIVPMDNDPVRR